MGRGSKKNRAPGGMPPGQSVLTDTEVNARAGKTAGSRGIEIRAPAAAWSGRRAWLLRLALLILSPVLFFGTLEGGLRLGGYGYPTGFFLGPDSSGKFITNYRFGWRFFPRSIARNPQRCVLSAKPAGTIRIFVLGSSAAMGTPDAAYSFGRIMEVMLRERYPGTRFEVVNGAMTAINSYVSREIARDCAARDPDLFVIYMGNNEVIGPYGPGTVFQHWSPGLKWIRASLWVKSTRVGQLLGSLSGALHPKADALVRWRGMEMFSNNPVPLDDPRLAGVYDNYRQNLNDICRIARNAGAGVVLSTVAVNLRDCPPFASRHRPGLSSEDLAKWESLYKSGSELVSGSASNRLSVALERFEAAAKIDDRYAELQFRLGECLLQAGRLEEARARFELARDLDALRFRADSHINAAIRDVAREQAAAGIRLVDAERGFAESDPNGQGIAGGGLFYEHVHLTFEGDYLLARSVLDQACEALPQLAGLRKQEPIASRQRCADLLAMTPWDEYQSAVKIEEMTGRAPFTQQFDHDLRQAAARRRTDELRKAASTPQAKESAWKIYKEALAGAPDDWNLHHHFGKLAMDWGRSAVAVEHLRFVVDKLPWDPGKHSELGEALFAEKKIDDGIAHYRKALELDPGNVDTLNTLGAALWRSGRASEAVVEFQKALQIDPGHEVVQNNFGSALVELGRNDEAIGHYLKAVELKPGYAEAHKNLAKVLLQKGQTGEAIEHFQKALQTTPDDAEVHYKLGQILAGLRRTDESIAHYQASVKIKPDDAAAHNNLGVLLAERGQVDEAIAHYQKALELKPDYSPAHSNLGSLLFHKGSKDEALMHFRKSVELKPDSAEAQLNLAIALRFAGKAEEAIRHFRRALELQPGNAEARKNLNAILQPTSLR